MHSSLCKFSALHKNSGMSENSMASVISHFSSWWYNIHGGDSLPGSLWLKSLTNHRIFPIALNRTSFHLTSTLPWPLASLLYLYMMLKVTYSFPLFLPSSLITFSHFFNPWFGLTVTSLAEETVYKFEKVLCLLRVLPTCTDGRSVHHFWTNLDVTHPSHAVSHSHTQLGTQPRSLRAQLRKLIFR